MNGGDVRDTWFVEVRDTFYERGVRGYDGSEVDDLLRRVADALASGQRAGPLIENATFHVMAGAGSRRYDIEAVDWFLERLLRGGEDHAEVAGTGADPWRLLAVANHVTLARSGHLSEPSAQPSWRARRKHLAERQKYFSGECANAWRDFGQQPGMHLRWGQVGTGRYELRTPERQTIVSVHQSTTLGGLRPERASLSTGGRKFTLRTSSARPSSPAVAQVFATSWHDYAGHAAAGSRKASAPPSEARYAGELVDETGAPVLYVGGRNYYSRACARITFPDQRRLRFLVRGTQPAHAIMTAVDHAGNKVARYRINGPVEIVVHPDRELTDELALAIAIAAPWLGSYLEIPTGAG